MRYLRRMYFDMFVLERNVKSRYCSPVLVKIKNERIPNEEKKFRVTRTKLVAIPISLLPTRSRIFSPLGEHAPEH